MQRLPDWSHDPEGTFRSVPLARWDAGWYYLIALHGYSYDPNIPQNTVGFYPLYPIAVRGAAELFGTPIYKTGVALSLLFLLGGLLLLKDLAFDWGGAEAVLPTLAALLLFPTAFFFASIYTESLFLFATTAAIWGMRRGRLVTASVAGFAAALTRLNGALILIPIAWYLGSSCGWQWRAIPARRLLVLAGPLAGAAAYPLYLWHRFGDPLLYFHEKLTPAWPHQPQAPWTFLLRTAAEAVEHARPGSEAQIAFFAGFGSAGLFVLLTILLFRRGLVAEGLYSAATLLFLVSGGSIHSFHRYVLSLFPCFFVLAQSLRERPVLAFAYAFAGAGAGILLLHRFVHQIFVA